MVRGHVTGLTSIGNFPVYVAPRDRWIHMALDLNVNVMDSESIDLCFRRVQIKNGLDVVHVVNS
jgi:hypothetical protein